MIFQILLSQKTTTPIFFTYNDNLYIEKLNIKNFNPTLTLEINVA